MNYRCPSRFLRDLRALWFITPACLRLHFSSAALAVRDSWIGWDSEQVVDHLKTNADESDMAWLASMIEKGLSEVYLDDLLDPAASPLTRRHLRHRGLFRLGSSGCSFISGTDFRHKDVVAAGAGNYFCYLLNLAVFRNASNMRSLLTAAILLFASLSWGAVAVITTSSIPAGTALLPYSASISAEGECQRYEWTITPLPTGLIAIVQTSSIAISGTPSIAGEYSFTVSVKDCGGHVASKTYALTIGRDDGKTGDQLLPQRVR